MTRLKFLLCSAFVAFLAFTSGTAVADGLTVQNASFETSNGFLYSDSGGTWNVGPIPGWNTTGETGSWQPNSSSFSALPDCCIVAFTNGGTISQTLTGDTVQPNTSYLLSVFVGNRLQGFTGNYTISFDAGSTTLCSFSGNSASITAGTFADETCSFQSGSVVPAGDLSILFTSISPGGGGISQLDVDNVSVTTSVAIPEPSSFALTGVGLFGLCLLLALRRKEVSPVTP